MLPAAYAIRQPSMDDSTRHITPEATSLTHIARNKCYEISYDGTKNRIYFSILGFWKSKASIPDFLNDWEKALQLVTPGFTVLIDMRTMITHPQQLNGLHEQSMKMIRDAGVSQIANVMPTDRIASLQINEITDRVELPVHVFETCKAADEWLDQQKI